VSDSVGYLPSSDPNAVPVAVDDIGGNKFQRIKLIHGADGVNDGDVSAANPLPVSAGSLPLPAGAATEATISAINGKVPALITRPADNEAPGIPMRLIGQEVWNVSFSEVGASVISSQFVTPHTGTGVSFSQATGALSVVAGTTANAEFFTRSVQSWRGSLRLKFATVLSQRLAANNVAVLLADLIGEGLAVTINSATSITIAQAGHPFTATSVGQFVLLGRIVGANGVPGRYAIASVVPGVSYNLTVSGWPASGSCTATVFGHSYVRNLFTGTTATAVAVDAQRRGWATGDTTATINTTASPGTVIHAELTGREVFWFDQLRASTITPTVAARASRVENIPDDNRDLYVFLWAFNIGTPASSTTWTMSFCSVEKFPNTPVYIQGARANGAANPLPVAQQGTVTVTFTQPALVAGTSLVGDVGVQYRATASGLNTTAGHVVAAGSTNATNIKTTAGKVFGWFFANTTASWRFVKLHNVAGTPTAGAAVARTIGIPPNGVASFFSEGGITFSTGIGFTIVTGAADADATAVTANDVVGDIFFA
jgi:hypothetical protein